SRSGAAAPVSFRANPAERSHAAVVGVPLGGLAVTAVDRQLGLVAPRDVAARALGLGLRRVGDLDVLDIRFENAFHSNEGASEPFSAGTTPYGRGHGDSKSHLQAQSLAAVRACGLRPGRLTRIRSGRARRTASADTPSDA